MKRPSLLALLLVALLVGASGPADAGDVNITIGAPAVVVAPPVIMTPPKLVVVPGTPVYTAPAVDFNVFVFGGKYWSHHNDVWFVAPRAGAQWTRVAVTAVPFEVRGVPVSYYKMKPKHAKGMKHDREHSGKGGKNR
jgi:hypothetical protein